jgi:hypothetical protein
LAERQGTISRDPNAHGCDCLPHDVPTTPLTAPGTTLVLRRKGTAPQLVGVWIPDYVNIKTDESLHYHVYFPPRVEAWNTRDWGDYPFTPNSNPTGQPQVRQEFVQMIYRHLFYEVKLAHATYATRAKTIIIIPIDDGDDAFRQWGGPTTAAVYTLILDVHAHLHFITGSSYWDWHRRGVGRVAISAYSAGVRALPSALTKLGDTKAPTIPLGLGKEMMMNHLREAYDFDAHEPGVGWSEVFGDLQVFFSAKPSDRRARRLPLATPLFRPACAEI